MPRFLIKVGQDPSAAKSTGIVHLHDPSPYISSEKNMLLLRIQAADESVKNGYKQLIYHESYFHRQDWTLLDEIRVRPLEQDKDKFLTFALFLDTNVQQNRISHTITSLFISTMGYFHYDAREKSKRSVDKAEMCEMRLLLKVKSPLGPAESSSSNQSSLGEISLKHTT